MTGSEIDDGAESDSLTRDELSEALGTLGRLELKRLKAAAAVISHGTGLDVDEVVSDAIDAALTTRECPRGLPIVAFLIQTIRSRVSNHRKKMRTSVVAMRVPAGHLDGNGMPEVVDPSPNAETALIEREAEGRSASDPEMVRKINDALGDDYEAQLCLAGWADGMKGQALRDLIGVDQKTLDYIAKRIRRVARRLFPKGWRP
jgi:DNA-directed RNA polymerase specialized sigma24 family protein